MLVMALWVICLCRIFSLSSSIPANPPFLLNSTETGGGGRKRNVLLVVAHPDDESMFFAPTIVYLTSNGHNLHILCICNGNAEGKGNTRTEELYRACAILKVSLHQITVVDHRDLQDGFDKPWKHQLLAAFVEDEISKYCIDAVITFDSYGVSGHPNHRDVNKSICMLLRENRDRDIEAWELISTNIVRKYLGPVDIWLSILSSRSGPSGSVYCLPNRHPLKSYQAMSEHYSQWVWFRKLFVILSRYTYINTLRRIDAGK